MQDKPLCTFWSAVAFAMDAVFVQSLLVGRPLLGRFTTVPSFFYLWIMALTVVRWSPKALEMAL